MPYEKRYTSKKRVSRRKRTYKKRTFGGKVARRMLNNAMSYMKKKYTIVVPITAEAGQNVA